MRELPILFNGPMVQAILAGRKTQTRRVVPGKYDSANWDWDPKDINYGPFLQDEYGEWHKVSECLSWQPGDMLWVRETWKCTRYNSYDGYLGYEVEFKDGTRKYFEFEDNERFHQFGNYALKKGWQSSLFMPREACRLWLEVGNVRVQRLQDISEDDAIAEGEPGYHHREMGFIPARHMYRKLWDTLNEKRGHGWDTNPWVAAIEFRRIAESNSSNNSNSCGR